MEVKQAENVIGFLEAVRQKPSLFVGTKPLNINDYLNGFDAAFSLMGFNGDFTNVRQEVQVERGWRISPNLIHDMQEHGLDEARIADELLAIHIETWKRLTNGIQEKSLVK